METKKQTFNGKDFYVVKGRVHPDYSYYTFEQEEIDFRNKYWQIKEGDVVFDIGASYGSYTLTAAVMGATVYSFEPEPTVFYDLTKNIELNNWQGKCFPFNLGLWNNEESIDMKQYAPHWPAYTISCNYNMKTLDQIVNENEISKIDWIKIDVEGAEENVIRGGLAAINKFKSKMLIECHPFLDLKITNNIKELLKFNYKFEEVKRDPCVLLYAEPKDNL